MDARRARATAAQAPMAPERAAPPGAHGAGFPGRAALTRVVALDFTWPAAAVALAIVYLLSRLPWLPLGFGTDPDAWRVAISARYLWEHGQYFPSRLPGYPLYELITAALYPGGALVTNSSTLIVSFAGVLLFASVLKRLRVEPKGLLTLAFAFSPMVWINSTITLDYLWGLTFTLASYRVLLGRGGATWPKSEWRSGAAAGLLLALAIGCRPTSALAALPFLVLLWRERRLPGAVAFCLAMGGVALLLFLPIIWRYGPAFVNVYDVRPTWAAVQRTLGVEAFGLATAFGFLLVALSEWRRLLCLPHQLRRDPHLAVAVLMVLLLFATFMRLPLEEAYLAPAVPFALIAVARLLRRRAVVAICLLLMMGSLLDFHTRSQQGFRSPISALAGIRPTPGRVLIDYELRRQRLDIVADLRAIQLPERSVVTAGFYYPIMAERYKDDLTLEMAHGWERNQIGPLTDHTTARDARDVIYVWLMKPGDARRYRAAGYRTFTMNFDRQEALTVDETYLPEQERFGVR